MKPFAKFFAAVAALYCLLWLALGLYFTYASKHKELLEEHLSRIFDQPVQIGSVDTAWTGLSPKVLIKNMYVEGEDKQAAFAFESLSAALSPVSLFRFWPQFTEFAVSHPEMQVVALADGRLSVGGIVISNQRRGSNKRIIDWLMYQENGAWHDGKVTWIRPDQENMVFDHISFIYHREQEMRMVDASVHTRKGPVALTAVSQGDPFNDLYWDAQLEVRGNAGERLLKPEDFKVEVIDGRGELSLATLDVERIRDLVLLSGLTKDSGWLVDAKLSGSLHDLTLHFEGPLLDVHSWELQAAASEIGFLSVGRAPAMNHLFGAVNMSSKGGEFEFSAENSVFRWDRWFEQEFPIDYASGVLTWDLTPTGAIDFSVRELEFNDPHAKIHDVSASMTVFSNRNGISEIRDLLDVEKVLGVGRGIGDEQVKPSLLTLDGRFQIDDASQIHNYLPRLQRIDKFKKFTKMAMKNGQLTNGTIQYQGEVSKQAIDSGESILTIEVDYQNAQVDFAPQDDWPAVSNSEGVAKIQNNKLSVIPSSITWLGEDIDEAILEIDDLWSKKRRLYVSGKADYSLKKGAEFLFQGPLIKAENRPEKLPVEINGGSVNIALDLSFPLDDPQDIDLEGVASIVNGNVVLPEGVAATNIATTVNFTEDTIVSDKVSGQFLGGQFRGVLSTVAPAKPPIMKLSASGDMQVAALQPWVGEHMLTQFAGSTKWRGDILIDEQRLDISASSDLVGVAVSSPTPLNKSFDEVSSLSVSMTTGGNNIRQTLEVKYGDFVDAKFAETESPNVDYQQRSLFDLSAIHIGQSVTNELRPGVNIYIDHPNLDLDLWSETIVDLALYEPEIPTDNTEFLDAMRLVSLTTTDSQFMSRPFADLSLQASSSDGWDWTGTVSGQHVEGKLNAKPRAENGFYDLQLLRLNIPEEGEEEIPLDPIDYSLVPKDYPHISLNIDEFRSAGKRLGRLSVEGKPVGDEWRIDELSLQHYGIRTTASGAWSNTEQTGSFSRFDFRTDIDEAEGALNEMDFEGVIRKGKGDITGVVEWIGAPHEFDYSRLAGDFNAFIKDGELVQIEPGGGKLLGLLNVNTILRRLTFDFRDVFASGFQFDRMRFSGVLAEGEAILQEAFIISPAAFVRMEGKIDLDEELIDMEMHVSPDLGGNLALISALANPAAGAIVFIGQQVFKDEMRNSSFISYRANGTWEDFELEEINEEENTSTSGGN